MLWDVWAFNKLWQTMESWLSSENILKPCKITPNSSIFIGPGLSCMVLHHFVNSSVFRLCKLDEHAALQEDGFAHGLSVAAPGS